MSAGVSVVCLGGGFKDLSDTNQKRYSADEQPLLSARQEARSSPAGALIVASQRSCNDSYSPQLPEGRVLAGKEGVVVSQ